MRLQGKHNAGEVLTLALAAERVKKYRHLLRCDPSIPIFVQLLEHTGEQHVPQLVLLHVESRTVVIRKQRLMDEVLQELRLPRIKHTIPGHVGLLIHCLEEFLDVRVDDTILVQERAGLGQELVLVDRAIVILVELLQHGIRLLFNARQGPQDVEVVKVPPLRRGLRQPRSCRRPDAVRKEGHVVDLGRREALVLVQIGLVEELPPPIRVARHVLLIGDFGFERCRDHT
mmetsp:Transcript_128119/g.370902  ORF Transcript_128119/g.370902 Transcript_128119/m.370902 type:complete len:229 (-) Transcript_128119:253-939(-)